jgi:hypothetical protein
MLFICPRYSWHNVLYHYGIAHSTYEVPFLLHFIFHFVELQFDLVVFVSSGHHVINVHPHSIAFLGKKNFAKDLNPYNSCFVHIWILTTFKPKFEYVESKKTKKSHIITFSMFISKQPKIKAICKNLNFIPQIHS